MDIILRLVINEYRTYNLFYGVVSTVNYSYSGIMNGVCSSKTMMITFLKVDG